MSKFRYTLQVVQVNNLAFFTDSLESLQNCTPVHFVSLNTFKNSVGQNHIAYEHEWDLSSQFDSGQNRSIRYDISSLHSKFSRSQSLSIWMRFIISSFHNTVLFPRTIGKWIFGEYSSPTKLVETALVQYLGGCCCDEWQRGKHAAQSNIGNTLCLSLGSWWRWWWIGFLAVAWRFRVQRRCRNSYDALHYVAAGDLHCTENNVGVPQDMRTR